VCDLCRTDPAIYLAPNHVRGGFVRLCVDCNDDWTTPVTAE
jgi:hypothetical protein